MISKSLFLSLLLVTSTISTLNANQDALSGLDACAQTPQEQAFNAMMNQVKTYFAKVITPQALQTSLEEKDKALLLDIKNIQNRMKEITQNPEFEAQSKKFEVLNQEFEKKSNPSQEMAMSFLKRAEKECPVALEYMSLTAHLQQIKMILSELLTEAFFAAVEHVEL